MGLTHGAGPVARCVRSDAARLISQDDYRSSFELFEDLRVFGSTRVAVHSLRYDQFPKYEALELIVVRIAVAARAHHAV